MRFGTIVQRFCYILSSWRSWKSIDFKTTMYQDVVTILRWVWKRFWEDLGSIWEAKLGPKSIKNHVEIWLKIWLEKNRQMEARLMEQSQNDAGVGGMGWDPKLIRSGKIWRMVSHARAPDGGPADLKGLRPCRRPENLIGLVIRIDRSDLFWALD